jgi:hypothetical protein
LTNAAADSYDALQRLQRVLPPMMQNILRLLLLLLRLQKLLLHDAS